MNEWEKKNFYRLIGDRIKQFREKSNLTQSALARKLTISRASVVNIEKGRQNPPLHLLWEISENLGIGIIDLIPNGDEVKIPTTDNQLSEELLEQIRKSAEGDPYTLRQLTNFVKTITSQDQGEK